MAVAAVAVGLLLLLDCTSVATAKRTRGKGEPSRDLTPHNLEELVSPVLASCSSWRRGEEAEA